MSAMFLKSEKQNDILFFLERELNNIFEVEMMTFGIVIVTCSQKEAKSIAQTVVEKKLAACVNILPQITSIYTWKGKIEEEQESLLIMKSRKDLFNQLSDQIKSIHSYDVPEIIFLPILEGNQAYLNWIVESTK